MVENNEFLWDLSELKLTLLVENTNSQSPDQKSKNKVKREAHSASMSSLSPVSQVISPTTATAENDDAPSSPCSSVESHQPPPAPAVPQFQTFGPDPSTFPDPTRYHVPKVDFETMTDAEIKEYASVAIFPRK